LHIAKTTLYLIVPFKILIWLKNTTIVIWIFCTVYWIFCFAKIEKGPIKKKTSVPLYLSGSFQANIKTVNAVVSILTCGDGNEKIKNKMGGYGMFIDFWKKSKGKQQTFLKFPNKGPYGTYVLDATGGYLSFRYSV